MKTIIIGAGPASLMAATQAIKKGDEVLVFEKMKTAGRKFLVAGDGGFNLSHIGDFDEFVSYYSHSQMADIIRQFTNNDLVQFLKELGIDTYVGSSGKIFPIKEIKPAMVLNTWLNYLKKQGVQFFYHSVLEDFDNQKVIIRSTSGLETYVFDRLILGLGAASWPKTGSDAAWVPLFQSKKIQLIPFVPSNAGVNVNLPKEFLHQFQGNIFKNVVVSHNGISRKGEVVLTEYGVEGAPIYYLNPSIRKDFKLPIYIDFKQTHSEVEILTILINSRNVSDGLKKLKLPTAFVFWCKQFLSKEEYNELSLISHLIKQFPIYINSFRPLEEAISCAGGVSWNELNEKLQLKKFPAVFVVGEMVDWETPTGGYLLQGTFSMGFVAGN
jgi:uncharacterized flavoprotein (TIGR03862 family)